MVEEEIIQLDSSPYLIFIFAIRSPITREKYLQRIGYFFDYIGIEQDTIEERCNIFGQKAKGDINWVANNILKYLQVHKNRVEQKEITGSTLKNYIKPIKLFCEQMDITIPWNKITRGMPKGRKYARFSLFSPTLFHKYQRILLLYFYFRKFKLIFLGRYWICSLFIKWSFISFTLFKCF
jgi:hypothetical protein